MPRMGIATEHRLIGQAQAREISEHTVRTTGVLGLDWI